MRSAKLRKLIAARHTLRALSSVALLLGPCAILVVGLPVGLKVSALRGSVVSLLTIATALAPVTRLGAIGVGVAECLLGAAARERQWQRRAGADSWSAPLAFLGPAVGRTQRVTELP